MNVSILGRIGPANKRAVTLATVEIGFAPKGTRAPSGRSADQVPLRIAVCALSDDGGVAAVEVVDDDRVDNRVAQRDCPHD